MAKQNDPIVEQFVQQDNSTENLAVVIILKDDCKTVDISQLCSLEETDEPKYHLKEIKQITGKFCKGTLKKLIDHPIVKHVHHDYEVHINLNIATVAIGAKNANNRHNLTGNGVTVAVIDSGIYRHYDLIYPTNRIIGFRDFVNGRTVPYDDNGHGTHVAGAIAGNGAARADILA
ncbi:S8 family serine peptidase [Alteribacillus bidgolensis]|uniref:Serine protease AprX n=1 Tax=Alteribacillus bidgolensis TaxID=930129 RepID=A0A1G8I2U0_9BACI|nr:S8 family serine peptidase [Alteribacillus bidgolensis]SDI13276.1 serine protease AprX [Alteribacillus bidgolensis]